MGGVEKKLVGGEGGGVTHEPWRRMTGRVGERMRAAVCFLRRVSHLHKGPSRQTHSPCVRPSVRPRRELIAHNGPHCSSLTYMWRSGGVACALMLQFADVCLPRFCFVFFVVCVIFFNEVGRGH